MKRLLAFAVLLVLLVPCVTLAGGFPWLKDSNGDYVTYDGSRIAAAIAPPVTTIANGMILTEAQMSGGTLANIGATGTVQINVPDVDKELFFFVDARVAQIIEIGFVESGANPYLQGQQIGADNEIDVPAGAKLRIQRMQRGGSWVWWCTILWGVPVDGGPDD